MRGDCIACDALLIYRLNLWFDSNYSGILGFRTISRADYVLLTVTPLPIFKVNTQTTEVYLIAKIEISLEQMDGYSSDLSGYIIVTGLRHIKVLVTLTLFLRT